MKFTKKAGVVIAGAALLGTSLAALPLDVKNASALPDFNQVNPWETATSSNSFTISGLKEISEKTIGEKLEELKEAPTFAGAPAGSVVKAVLTDPYNDEVTLTQTDKGVVAEANLPTLNKRGTYTLYYVLLESSDEKAAELAKSEVLQVKVSGSSYEFNFPSNQYYTKKADNSRINAFIPAKTSANYSFSLPIPNVINSKNGAFINDGDIKITVAGTDGKTLVEYTLGGEPVYSSEATNHIAVTPVEVSFENSEAYDAAGTTKKSYKTLELKTKDIGVYKITYSYVGNLADGKDNTSEIKAVYDVQAVATADLDMNNEKVRKLSATFEGTGIDTSAVIGEEFTVPAPKVTNKVDTSEVIDFRTKMEVVYVRNGVEEGIYGEGQNKRTDISSTFKFTPQAGKTGLYRIYYTVYDVYGNKTIEYCQPLTNVADTKRPNIYVVENYTVSGEGTEKTTSLDGKDEQTKVKNGYYNADYKIPTVVDKNEFSINYYGAKDKDNSDNKGKTVNYSAAIVVPAVYATDNAVNYGGITLKRRIILSSGTFSANGLSTIEVDKEWVKQHPGETYPGENEAVVIYLEYEGEYTVEYSAYDGARYSYAQYTVTVGDNSDERTPNIEDLKVGYTYEKNSEIKFARPTADDDVDRRVKVDTYYYFADDGETPKFKDSANGDAETALTTGTYKYADIVKELTATEGNATGVAYLKPTGNSINAYRGTSEDLKNYYISTAEHTGTLYIVTVSTDYSNRFNSGKFETVDAMAKADGKASVVVTAVAPAATITDQGAVNFDGINQTITERKYTAAGVDPSNSENKIGYYDFAKSYITNVHQHNEVLLPYLEFSDYADETFNVSISVAYLDKETGKLQAPNYTTTNEVVVTNTTTIVGGDNTRNITIIGGSFIPTKVGYYVVTYTARDAAGNLTSKTFQMVAKDTDKPSVIAQGYKSEMEIGESQTFYQAVITDNGERVNNPTNVVMSMVDYGDGAANGVNPSKSGFDAKNKTFTPTVIGEYHFKFTYTDAAGNVGESDIIKIKVQDTTKPTISLINNSNAVSFLGVGETTKYPNLEKENAGDSSSEYKPIVIPNFTAEDNSGKQYITYSISVKKDGVEIFTTNADKAGTSAPISFTPGKTKRGTTVNANGIYEITYSAKDRYNPAETQTYKLAVGDVEPPKIEFTGSDEVNKQNQPTGEFKLNKDGKYTLTIDTRYIKATDESNEFANANAKDPSASTPDYSFGQVTVYLSLSGYGEVKGEDNGNGVYTFVLDTAGSYTLRYSVTDRADNYTSAPYTFTVVENDGGSTTATIVWAVVLSVLALCGLGVAIYFLLRDKKSKKPRTVKNKKDKDDNDEGKLVV